MRINTEALEKALLANDIETLRAFAEQELSRMKKEDQDRSERWAKVASANGRWSDEEQNLLKESFSSCAGLLDQQRCLSDACLKIKRTRAAVYRMAKNKGYMS